MIEALRVTGSRFYVPMDLVKAITEDKDGDMTLIYVRHNGEADRVKISSFKIMSPGEAFEAR